MNLSDSKYSRYSICKEMLETADVVKNFDIESVDPYLEIAGSKRVLLTGEGSSRIFPAKNAICTARRLGSGSVLFTEAATQAMEYSLSDAAVFVASNSGKTKECVSLIRRLKADNHRRLCGVVANADTPVEKETDLHYILTCGSESAVAATKSVVEQALFYDVLFRKSNRLPLPDLSRLSEEMRKAMEMRLPEEITRRLAVSTTLYWAGRNDGTAEELTLKSNEIAKKKSDFLEGTYAVHGIEEVMDPTDAVIIIDPFESEEQKFREVLERGVGLSVFAVCDRETHFPTVRTGSYPEFQPYIEMAAGWNVLVEVGVKLGIDLDKAERARKVGNEYPG